MDKEKGVNNPKKIGFMKWVARTLIIVLILTIIACGLFEWLWPQNGSWM